MIVRIARAKVGHCQAPLPAKRPTIAWAFWLVGDPQMRRAPVIQLPAPSRPIGRTRSHACLSRTQRIVGYRSVSVHAKPWARGAIQGLLAHNLQCGIRRDTGVGNCCPEYKTMLSP